MSAPRPMSRHCPTERAPRDRIAAPRTGYPVPPEARLPAPRLAAAEAAASLWVLWHFSRAHRAEAGGDRRGVIAAASLALAADAPRARFTAALRRLAGGAA